MGFKLEQPCERPMTIEEILKKNYRILKENFTSLVLLNFIAFLPFFLILCVIAIIVGTILVNNPSIFSNGSLTQTMINQWIGLALLGLFVLLILMASGMYSMYLNVYGIFQIYDQALQGRTIGWRDSLRGSKIPVIYFLVLMVPFNAIVTAISICLGVFNLFLPIFFIPQIMIAYGAQMISFVALPSIALEKKTPIAGFLRSCSLVWKYFGQVIAIYFLYITIAIISFVVVFVLSAIPLSVWIFSIYSSGFQCFDPLFLFNPWLILSLMIIIILGLFLGFILFNFYYGLQVMMLHDLKKRNEG